ncbi:MAG: Stf0 family sulfotransferase, partial [Roseibium sp.]
LRYFQLDDEVFDTETEQLKAVFSAAWKKGTNGTGLFGLRLQRGSFAFFSEKLRHLHPGPDSDVGRVEAAFGKTLFIHLTRGDKLAQAVSLVKATQSGLWHKAPDGTELERVSEPRAPVYDAEAISRQIELMTAHDRDWAGWFASERIEPLRITYDALSSDPEAVLKRVFARLGLDEAAATGIDLPVAKLADDINREWMDRYRSEQV